MRTTICPLCGCPEKKILKIQTFKDLYLDMIDASYMNMERTIVECKNCSFIYRNPTLDENDLDVLYKKFRDMSLRGETPDEYFDRITSLPEDQSENFSKLIWIKEFLSEYLPLNGNILDVGCGGGVFLSTFNNAYAHWNMYGIEPTTSFSELARRRANANIYNGTYIPGIFPIKFNLITVNQVLEHVTDPVQFLKNLKKDLLSNGIIYLEVPDISDFADLPEDHDRFHMQHLSIFSSATLTQACKKAGFQIVKLSKEKTFRGKNNLVVGIV